MSRHRSAMLCHFFQTNLWGLKTMLSEGFSCALIAACAAVSGITIGVFFIPCATFTTGICAGGVYLAGSVTFETLVELWNP